MPKIKLKSIFLVLFVVFIGIAAMPQNVKANPYYNNPSLPPPVISWNLDDSGEFIVLTISSSVDRSEIFKFYKTELEVRTLLASENLYKDASITLAIYPSDPPEDITMMVTSMPATGGLEFIEWEYTFTASMFIPAPLCVCEPINIASIQGSEICWNVDTDFLKLCLSEALHSVFIFDDTISHIDTISINFDSLENDYILTFDVHFANSTDVFSDYIVLSEEDGDIYIDTDKDQPIIWKVAIVMVVKAIITINTMPELQCPTFCDVGKCTNKDCKNIKCNK